MSNILLEVTAAIDYAGTLQTFYLSTGAFTTGANDTPANTSFDASLIDPGSIGVHAFSDGRVGGRTRLDIGEIVIANVDGHLDDWLSYGFDGREAVIRYAGSGYQALRSVDYWEVKQAPFEYDWLAVAWSPQLGLFAAVAEAGTASGNRVMTSPDGITWTARASASDNAWQAICWSPELGLFCAVARSGTGNRVMTSPDGITWTSRTSAADNSWQAICWSPELGLFCAVAQSGTGNRVMTSPDGITWTSRTSAADNNWTSVCWAAGLGLFIAVAQSGSGNRVMTSANGTTWTARANPVDNDWTFVCWSPELALLVAVSADPGSGNRVMTSDDGIVWTMRITPVDNDWVSVTWSPELSLFCAVAQSPGATNPVMTSPDGISWTTRTIGADNMWGGMCWSPELGIFCAVALTGSNRIAISPAADNYPNGYPTLLRGTVESMEATTDQIVLRLRDRSYMFDRPVLTNTYLGNNVLPDGLEGTADDIKGQVKPKVFGKVLNVTPKPVNTSKLTYQVHDGSLASIDAVYDRGVALTAGTNYATSALLQAAAVTAGTYDTCVAEGYFRLGSSPSGLVTCDATAKTSDADMTPGQVLKQLAVLSGLASTDVWTETLNALDWANSATVGRYVDDWTTTFTEAMDEVAASCNAYYGFDQFGKFRMGQLTVPGSDPISTLTSGEILSGFERVPTKDFGIPVYAFALNHSRNWTVQTTDIAGAVTDARRAFLALPDRTERAENAAVLNKHLLAGVEVSDSLFSDVQSPPVQNYRAVAWAAELGVFAVTSVTASANKLITSRDGISWVARSAPANLEWSGICWSAELVLFCAVAPGGIMTSADAITWTSRSLPAGNATDSFRGVCWSSQLRLFVAVANSGPGSRLMSSPDGITWTTRTPSSGTTWAAVCWSPQLGQFVAVANSGDVMVSTDGLTWNARTSAAANIWRGVCWSPELGLYVAVGSSGTGNRIMTSPDGATWTSRTNPADLSWFGVIWVPELGLLVAVSSSLTGADAMTSPDGITWTQRSTPNGSYFNVAWSAQLGRFVAPENASGAAPMTSYDGIVWERFNNVADYEAARRLALFDQVRAIYNTPVPASVFATIPLRLLSDIEVQYNRFGFGISAGQTLKVIGYDLNLRDDVVTLNLWG